MFQRAFTAAALASALLLAGCATGPAAITSQVQSYASMQGVALPSTYRLEVLPSQAQQASFARIEMAADTALTKVGLQRAPRPEQAKLVVQVGASAGEGRAQHPTWDPYYYGPRFGWGLGYGGGYFDRTLAQLDTVAIGVGFELGRVPSTWPQSHDRPMQWIVTEAGAARVQR